MALRCESHESLDVSRLLAAAPQALLDLLRPFLERMANHVCHLVQQCASNITTSGIVPLCRANVDGLTSRQRPATRIFAASSVVGFTFYSEGVPIVAHPFQLSGDVEVIKAAIECWVVQLLAEVLEATLNLVFLPFTALELDIAKGINVVDCIVPCKSGKVVAPFLPDGVSVDPLPDVRIVEGRSGAAGGDQDGQRHPLGGLSN